MAVDDSEKIAPMVIATRQSSPSTNAPTVTTRAVPSTCKPAQPQQLVAHRPKRSRFQFQPDQEQHHHHAKLGEMLQFGDFVGGMADELADDDARPADSPAPIQGPAAMPCGTAMTIAIR